MKPKYSAAFILIFPIVVAVVLALLSGCAEYRQFAASNVRTYSAGFNPATNAGEISVTIRPAHYAK